MDKREASMFGQGDDRRRLAPEDVEMIGEACASGSCPAVYRTRRGTFVVQGHAVGPHEVGIDLAPGERLVEVPEDVLLAAAARVAERRAEVDQP